MNAITAADELEIRNLTARFTDAVNRQAAEDLGDLMAHDAQWHVPGLDVAVGPQAAAERITGLLSTFPHLIQLLHGGTVTVDGDRGTARWYISETAQGSDGKGFAFTGIYDDDLIRTEAGWRFAARTFTFLYRGAADHAGKWYPHRGDRV